MFPTAFDLKKTIEESRKYFVPHVNYRHYPSLDSYKEDQPRSNNNDACFANFTYGYDKNPKGYSYIDLIVSYKLPKEMINEWMECLCESKFITKKEKESIINDERVLIKINRSYPLCYWYTKLCLLRQPQECPSYVKNVLRFKNLGYDFFESLIMFSSYPGGIFNSNHHFYDAPYIIRDEFELNTINVLHIYILKKIAEKDRFIFNILKKGQNRLLKSSAIRSCFPSLNGALSIQICKLNDDFRDIYGVSSKNIKNYIKNKNKKKDTLSSLASSA